MSTPRCLALARTLPAFRRHTTRSGVKRASGGSTWRRAWGWATLLALGLAVATAPLAAQARRPAAAPPASPVSPPQPPPATNAAPTFVVRSYEVTGNTLLSTGLIQSIFAPFTGTNVAVSQVVKAAAQLQTEYRSRGYPTVNVTIPAQRLTNGVVKIRVFEGRLVGIMVVNNHYFSSNNVMRALPSLHTNTILVGPVFSAELDRANANQDRQISGELSPGPVEDTSLLLLHVNDRLPLHGKVEFSNQSSPGTPELRLNASAMYDNLWQLDHALGVQYSFSPELYKTANQWSFYDQPRVANYSAFYRLPLGAPQAVADALGQNNTGFGYDEATRRFRLPASLPQPELTFFASRSTIDTGLETLANDVIYNVPGVRQVTRQDFQQDLTLNGDLGARFSLPLPDWGGIHSTLSLGIDFKTFQLTSFKTNNFQFTEITVNANGTPNPPVVYNVPSPVPTTARSVQYLPLSLRWDGTRRDASGMFDGSLGYSPNVFGWLFNEGSQFMETAGSSQANGYYHVLTASFGRDQEIFKDWHLALHADGQWASQPLIVNEQYGLGGVAGLRGYREGEVFGDNGWRVTLEQKTPPHVVGITAGKQALVIRGSIYTDYGEGYLIDPAGRQGRIPLWGVGFGGVATFGSHFDARLLCTWPLLSTPFTEAGQPRLDFALSAQF